MIYNRTTGNLYSFYDINGNNIGPFGGPADAFIPWETLSDGWYVVGWNGPGPQGGGGLPGFAILEGFDGKVFPVNPDYSWNLQAVVSYIKSWNSAPFQPADDFNYWKGYMILYFGSPNAPGYSFDIIDKYGNFVTAGTYSASINGPEFALYYQIAAGPGAWPFSFNGSIVTASPFPQPPVTPACLNIDNFTKKYSSLVANRIN